MRKSALTPDEIRDMCASVDIADSDIANTLGKALDYSPVTVRCWLRGSRPMTTETRKKFLTWIQVRKDEQERERLLIEELTRQLA